MKKVIINYENKHIEVICRICNLAETTVELWVGTSDMSKDLANYLSYCYDLCTGNFNNNKAPLTNIVLDDSVVYDCKVRDVDWGCHSWDESADVVIGFDRNKR